MTPLFTVVTTCKGRLDHLKITLPRLMAFADSEVVVVDYDCPDGAGAWVRANHPAALVVRVENEPLFNLAKARNLGVAAASAPWLFLVDADVLVSPGLAEALAAALDPNAYFIPYPRSAALWGALLVAREQFEAVGGYDEVFEGWGSEDVDLIWRLEQAGCSAGTFPGAFLSSVPHSDGLRTRFHDIAEVRLNGPINALYAAAKRDLFRHGVSVTPEQARGLYAGIRASAQTNPGGAFQVNVTLPQEELSGRVLRVSLSYSVSAGGGHGQNPATLQVGADRADGPAQG